MAIKYNGFGTYINAKLSFKKYVTPANYSSIRERLEIPRETFSGFVNSTPLSVYLNKIEGLHINISYGIHDRLRNERKVSIKPNKRKMTLEISVKSEKFLEMDELLNVLNLHRFILTGKYPETSSGPQP